MQKKNFILITTSALLAVLNLFSWQLTLKIDIQLAWVALILVFVNLTLAWLVQRRNVYVALIFIGSSFLIEFLLLINYFWIYKLGKTP